MSEEQDSYLTIRDSFLLECDTTTKIPTQITLVEKDIIELLPGEMTSDASKKYWYVGCPKCKEPGALSGHTVTEVDGLVTVSPSLLCSCSAHYFIEHNQIRWL